ncbi:MAG: hypothetical protein M3444_04435 [Acidobacteriota bacterium]|nr:hypothetical protein [Acidobacteriota bacterium]MDQ5837663.1 hypothetical protein [Acidobacteriota bacterium]
MRNKGLNLALGLGLLLCAALACKFNASTANLSGLKVAKDKAATQEASSFSPTDTIYAVAEVSNVPDKVKVKGRLLFDDVEGQPNGPVPGAETTLDLPGSGTATYTFTPPPSGWPKGKYKVEATMMTEEGEQKDQKSATFSVN